MKIVVEKINEVYVKLYCDRSTAYELTDYFSFYVKNFQFHPNVKKKLWDGKIRLYNLKDSTLYIGLLNKLVKFCKERDYQIQIDQSLNIKNIIDDSKLDKIIESFELSKKYQLRDYQKNSLKNFLMKEKMLLLSPTGCMDPDTEIEVYVSEETIEYINTLRQGLKTYPVGETIENKNSKKFESL